MTFGDFLAFRPKQMLLDALIGPTQWCKERVPEGNSCYAHWGWRCTRPVGHCGPHIATAMSHGSPYTSDFTSRGIPFVVWSDPDNFLLLTDEQRDRIMEVKP